MELLGLRWLSLWLGEHQSPRQRDPICRWVLDVVFRVHRPKLPWRGHHFRRLRHVRIGNSLFALFLSNRYSILWGDSRNDAEASTALICTPRSASFASGMTASRVNDLFIAELQAGMQWQRQLVWFPGRAFLLARLNISTGTPARSCASATSESLLHAADYSTACAEAERILFNMVGFNLGGGIIF